MTRYKVQFEFDLDATDETDASLRVLQWFGEGMMPIADVTPVDDEYNETGPTVAIDTEAVGIGAE